jgi:hypothetical protein
MKKKIIYGLLFAVAMVTASSSFVSCKDYEGDDYAAIRERIAIDGINSNATLDELIKTQLSLTQAQLDNLMAALIRMQNPSPADLKAAENYQKQLSNLQSAYNNATTIAEKVGILNQLTQLLASLNGTSGKTPGAVVVPSATDVIIKLWGDSLYHAYITADAADKLSKDNKYRLDTLNLRVDSLFNEAKKYADQATLNMYQTIMSTLLAKMSNDSLVLVNAIKTAQSKLEQDRKNDSIKFENDLNKIDSVMRANDADLAAKLNKIDSAYKAGDSILTVRCNDIEAGYKKAVAGLQTQIDGLTNKLDNLFGTLKKQISGIIVQGTYSPVFGYGSLPLGIQTNILAAYAGKAVADVQFPSAMKSFDNRNIITEADLAWLESNGMMPASENITAGQLLFNDNEGNAGKMFLTVNPTNVDFSGTDFKLVNSKGYESRIKLSALNASDEVMTFGWTRGTKVGTESANGFYEVNATIAKDDALKMQPDFDKAGFKNAVKTAVSGQARLAVKEAARALFNSLQPAERFGVKAEWDEPVAGARSVTSAFDIAALSIEPLGFGFKLPSSKYTRIPTLNQKVIAEKLHIDLHVEPIVITAQDKETGKYIVLVEIPMAYISNEGTFGGYTVYPYTYIKELAGTYYLSGGYTAREGYAYIDFTPMFEEYFGAINAKFADFNKASDGINKTIDDAAAQVNSYIDRANNWINRINSVLDNLGNIVQPVLIWSDGQSAGELGGFVSANYAVGTVVPKDGQLALVPTSYSLELFAPAYKKSLIVTNAYRAGLSAQSGKDVDLVDAVKALNNSIKAQGFDVFSGTSLKKPYIFSAKGYEGITFEIAYTAVDYEGQIAGRKFYLTVGE